MQYTVVHNDDQTAVTVFVKGRAPLVAATGHPNLEAILSGLAVQDASVIDLFDVAETIKMKFARLSDQVTVENGKVFLDGVEMKNALTDQIVRVLQEGGEFKSLVNFYEKLQSNPNEDSREQLYRWLASEDFTITDEGLIVGYKSVYKNPDGSFRSTRGGNEDVRVNDVVQRGVITQKIGDTVEMARDVVHHDPSAACHIGLHVGNYEYASTFSGDTVLEVRVNPRDVVSVPSDSQDSKMRVCRYVVVDESEKKHVQAIVYTYDLDEDAFADDEDEPWYGDDNPEEVVDTLDEEHEDTPDEVQPGDVFETTDKRRAGTQFKVESIEGDHAIGKTLPRNLTRKVALDRLLSYRYTKIN